MSAHAHNIVQRASLLAALDPQALATSGLNLAELDNHIEDVCTALARRGLVPNDGLFDPDEERQTTETWTFFGHWEGSRIVVESHVPGDVQDERVDTGYWEEGLWAAAGSGATVQEAQAAAVAEYEEGDEGEHADEEGE